MVIKTIKSQKTESKVNLLALTKQMLDDEAVIREGGGKEGRERQRRLNRLTARERLRELLDHGTSFFELGLFSAWEMYQEFGSLPAAGVLTGIGTVSDQMCMVIINDATVKAGAMFPQSVKKVLRAQRIAFESRLPILYLVDSSGVFLPLQEDIFPDEDDFGRIFRNNAVISAAGIPQFAAIMGNCIAGGGYLPVLCDKLLMTQGSGLYLAGPALVKAAIGQIADPEELGGAKMHAELSGTVDFLEPDDQSCIKRLRSLMDLLPKEAKGKQRKQMIKSGSPPDSIYQIVPTEGNRGYDVRDLLACIIDEGSLQEYKSAYGKTLVTAFAKINGIAVGIVANQRIQTVNGKGSVEIGGVIYADAADKAARFVLDCNQMLIPILFFQDVMGFMVGREAEQSGIIRSGAKLVNAVSNSIVPKITIVVGNSFGAGNYALCGKAYDPNFILAWPNANFAVMGADQAADTLFTVQSRAAERKGAVIDQKKAEQMHEMIRKRYEKQMDIRYGAARGWVDAIIAPDKTREILSQLLLTLSKVPPKKTSFHTGVIQL